MPLTPPLESSQIWLTGTLNLGWKSNLLNISQKVENSIWGPAFCSYIRKVIKDDHECRTRRIFGTCLIPNAQYPIPDTQHPLPPKQMHMQTSSDAPGNTLAIRFQNGVPGAGYWVLGIGYWVLGMGYWVLGWLRNLCVLKWLLQLACPGFRPPDPGSRIQDPRSRIRDPGSRILDPGSRVRWLQPPLSATEVAPASFTHLTLPTTDSV